MCIQRWVLVLFLVANLWACSRSKPAPVVDAWKQKTAGRYRVQPGDTLYSVAFAFEADYRDIAQVNQLSLPYTLEPGQWLIMKNGLATPDFIVQKESRNPTKNSSHGFKAPPLQYDFAGVSESSMQNPTRWEWPVKSKILQGFTGVYAHSQGIDLAGWNGRDIHATAAGLVVYSGTGVRGYGNLVILKHSEEYLSAYAYASQRFVHVGEWVKAGQRIATMGQDAYGRVRLHFELRRDGEPVDPLRYLP
jgi:lipoprotein NlpD